MRLIEGLRRVIIDACFAALVITSYLLKRRVPRIRTRLRVNITLQHTLEAWLLYKTSPIPALVHLRLQRLGLSSHGRCILVLEV